MNDFAGSIDVLKDIIVDPEFEGVCPALTEDEFTLLEQNIMSDGEVTSPLIVWNNRLIDGHHRRQIILKHPELSFHIKEIGFVDKYEAIAWICRNQAGRRNLTPEQMTYLIGKRYEAEKKSVGAPKKSGNPKSDLELGQIDPIIDFKRTSDQIAKEYGIGEASVRRAEQFANGVDAAEAACPGVKQELLSGSFKPTKKEVSALSKLPKEKIVERISEYRKGQEDRAEKRRQVREEKRRQEEETKESGKQFNSISELSANLAEPKRRNDVSNVIGILNDAAQKLQASCEAYIDEFPELMEADKPMLFQALDSLKEYLNELYKEE